MCLRIGDSHAYDHAARRPTATHRRHTTGCDVEACHRGCPRGGLPQEALGAHEPPGLAPQGSKHDAAAVPLSVLPRRGAALCAAQHLGGGQHGNQARHGRFRAHRSLVEEASSVKLSQHPDCRHVDAAAAPAAATAAANGAIAAAAVAGGWRQRRQRRHHAVPAQRQAGAGCQAGAAVAGRLHCEAHLGVVQRAVELLQRAGCQPVRKLSDASAAARHARAGKAEVGTPDILHCTSEPQTPTQWHGFCVCRCRWALLAARSTRPACLLCVVCRPPLRVLRRVVIQQEDGEGQGQAVQPLACRARMAQHLVEGVLARQCGKVVFHMRAATVPVQRLAHNNPALPAPACAPAHPGPPPPPARTHKPPPPTTKHTCRVPRVAALGIQRKVGQRGGRALAVVRRWARLAEHAAHPARQGGAVPALQQKVGQQGRRQQVDGIVCSSGRGGVYSRSRREGKLCWEWRKARDVQRQRQAAVTVPSSAGACGGANAPGYSSGWRSVSSRTRRPSVGCAPVGAAQPTVPEAWSNRTQASPAWPGPRGSGV